MPAESINTAHGALRFVLSSQQPSPVPLCRPFLKRAALNPSHSFITPRPRILPRSILLAGAALLAAVASAADIDTFRGTIPGALHQCESTSMNFFDSGNQRPLTLLFVPVANVPAAARTGTVTLTEAAAWNPLQVIEGITTADAGAYPFELTIAQGQVFQVFGFLPDGTGKDLSLTRTVMTPLPAATACVAAAVTTVAGIAPAATAAVTSTTIVDSSTGAAVATTSSTAAAVVPTTTSAVATSRVTGTSTVVVTATGAATTGAASKGRVVAAGSVGAAILALVGGMVAVAI